MTKIGRYNVIGELGRGSAGGVLKAHDPSLGRLVAIKVLSPSPSFEKRPGQAAEMFFREARATARLMHRGIVEVYDVLEDPETGTPCIVMEFVGGGTLASRLAPGCPLPTEQALDFARQIAEALDYAHGNFVLHHDLKPANILLTEDGATKISDFGLAEFWGKVGSIITDTICGTPAYMPPERISGERCNPRSDLYSLGVILYRMLTGHDPFEGDQASVLLKIVNVVPHPPSKVNPGLGTELDALVAQCMAKDPNERIGSAREIVEELDRSRGKTTLISKGVPDFARQRPALVSGEGGDARASRRKILPGVKVLKPLANSKAILAAMLLTFSAVVGPSILRRRQSERAPAAWGESRASFFEESVTRPPSSPSPSSLGRAATLSGFMGPANYGRNSGTGPLESSQAARRATHRIPEALNASRPSDSTQRAGALSSKKRAESDVWKEIRVVCEYDLPAGALTVSADGRPVLSEKLRGKKNGFLGIKKSYQGRLARALRIPANTRFVSLSVISSDQSLNLSDMASADFRARGMATLRASVKEGRLVLRWDTKPHPARAG